MLMRKKSVNVLKHLTKLTTDLDKIVELEEADKFSKQEKIKAIQSEIVAHDTEINLASKVSDNIKKLLSI